MIDTVEVEVLTPWGELRKAQLPREDYDYFYQKAEDSLTKVEKFVKGDDGRFYSAKNVATITRKVCMPRGRRSDNGGFVTNMIVAYESLPA